MTRAPTSHETLGQGDVIVDQRVHSRSATCAEVDLLGARQREPETKPTAFRPSAAPIPQQRQPILLPPKKSASRMHETGTLWLLLRLLQQIIRVGGLTIIDPMGRSHALGQTEPVVAVRISDWRTVRRIALNPDLAFGEAFMDGTLKIERGEVFDLLELCLMNLASHKGNWMQRMRRKIRHLTRRVAQHNPVPVARANVAHHYDLSDDLYELFLDPDRQYSCAYYMSPDDTLEVAQAQKRQHIAAKLLLRSGQKVLDIGSGWGGLALYLADAAGVDVTGITLSARQHEYAAKRSTASQVSSRVRFHLQDFRHAAGTYDRIVSVGMFEHVGVGHYREYFRKIKQLLTSDGVALIHTIGAADGPSAAHPWIERYIFPGGYTPALSEIVPLVEQAGLYITDVEVLRLHYAETLRAWRQRFMANRDKLGPLYDLRFQRMWEFYLAGCEAAFRHSSLVVFQIQLANRIDSVPLTRDYICQSEHPANAPTSNNSDDAVATGDV